MIAITIPSDDHVKAGFAMCLADLCAYSALNGIQYWRQNPRSSSIVASRCHGVHTAVDIGASHILWLDSDLEFPADTLERFLAHDVPIVGATYRGRRIPFDDLAVNTQNPNEAQALPGGCLLVRTEVYVKLGRPYYRSPQTEDYQVGEDYDFSRRAHDAGYTLHIDRSIHLTHLGEARLNL